MTCNDCPWRPVSTVPKLDPCTSTFVRREVRCTPSGAIIINIYRHAFADGRRAVDVCTWTSDGEGGFITSVTMVFE
jgi:hypothetical protein